MPRVDMPAQLIVEPDPGSDPTGGVFSGQYELVAQVRHAYLEGSTAGIH
eukprot:SAG31_NODE_1740_length_7394_cov_7.518849_6_plen_49_part_00